MRSVSFLAFAAPLTLCLAGCGAPDNVPAAEKTPDPTTELNPIQKANFERLNRDEVRRNYQGIVSGLDKTKPMPGQQDMDFTWLDQDKDGKLSVAEFMLWTMGDQPATTTAPTDDQVNVAASKLFANDLDGDTMLSAEEFAAAIWQTSTDAHGKRIQRRRYNPVTFRPCNARQIIEQPADRLAAP